MKQISSQIQPYTFVCNYCDFYSNKKCNYDAHLLTRKHRMKQNETNETDFQHTLQCNNCNIFFKSRTTLWRHKKQPCKTAHNDSSMMQCILQQNLAIIQQNHEFQKTIMELTSKVGDASYNSLAVRHIQNNVQNTQNNNHVSINVFLNEHCKDAVDIEYFMQHLEVCNEDLEYNADYGYVAGISNVILKNLSKYSIHERPMHCTDLKRHTLYIKSNGKWSKDTDEVNTNTSKVIREATRLCMERLSHWKIENPDYQDGDSDFSARALCMMRNSMQSNGGANPEQRIRDRLCVATKISIDKINAEDL